MLKSAYFLVCFIFLSLNLFSQSKKSEYDIYRYKTRPQDRLILELNHTGWAGLPNNLKYKPTSGGVNFLLFFDYPIGQSRLSFAWGAGISSHNIHGKIDLIYTIDSVSGIINYTNLLPREKDYRKNRIGVKLLEIPLEFRFRTRTNYQFKLMLGGKIGYVMQSFKKTFDDNGKYKTYDIYGMSALRYGLSLRLGWEQVHVTFFYALSELFESKKGPQGIHAFSAGIAYCPRISLGSGSKPID